MKSLFAAMLQDNSIRKLQKYFSGKARTLVYGLGNSQKHAAFAACFRESSRPTVILVHSREILEAWEEDLKALLPDVPVLELPEMDSIQIQATVKSIERSAKRMDVMGRLVRKENVIVLAMAAAAVQKGMSKSDFERMSIHISMGDVLPRKALLERFVQLGYECAAEVEYMGQFSARGSIVDIFPINSTVPFRIEFFDDEVDTIREFDLLTKRSLRNINSLSVLPLAEAGREDSSECFLSYLGENGTIVFDEPMRIREQIRSMVKENPELKKTIVRWEDLLEAAEGKKVI